MKSKLKTKSDIKISLYAIQKEISENILNISKHMKSFGINLNVFSKSNEIENLPLNSAIQINEKLKNILSIYKTCANEEGQFIWSLLKSKGWICNSMCFEKLNQNMVAELYELSSHKQICANMEFYKHVSYSLEEIYCKSAEELYVKTENQSSTEFSKRIELIHRNELQGIVDCKDLPEHWTQESNSPKMLEALIQQDSLVPITDKKGNAVALLSFYKVKVSRRQNLSKRINTYSEAEI